MPSIDFTLTTDYIELHKLLKLTGVVDSGGACLLYTSDAADEHRDV